MVLGWARRPLDRLNQVAPNRLRRIAPVFLTTDLGRALGHYQRLGFKVEAYDGADYYGYAGRDGIEIHIAKVDGLDCRNDHVVRLPLGG